MQCNNKSVLKLNQSDCIVLHNIFVTSSKFLISEKMDTKGILHHLLHLSKNQYTQWCKLMKHLVSSAQPVHIFRLRSKFFIRTESSAEATTEFSKSPLVRSPPRPPTSILYSLTPSNKVSSLPSLNFQLFFLIYTTPFILDQLLNFHDLSSSLN